MLDHVEKNVRVASDLEVEAPVLGHARLPESWISWQTYLTPRIQPSTSALTRSSGISDGSKKPASLPSRSAPRIQAAMEYASCWSAGSVEAGR